jgi:Rps23 Pro-64 3,4-dihydroxylase Tpa1-like proline 4-hydroxylase
VEEREQKPEPGSQAGTAPNDGQIPLKNAEPLLVSSALLEQAEQMCRRRLASDPDNRPMLRSLAQTFRKQGKLAEALPLYERLRRLDPDDREADYLHAILSAGDVPVLPAGLRPAPFVLLKDFLPRQIHEHLLPFALTVQDMLVPARVSSGEYKPEVRESLDLPGKCELKELFREHLSGTIPKILARLHVAPFEVGEFEVKIRAYLDGHFFRVHMDCPSNDKAIANRKVSYVYFFHKQPRAYTGGELLLFDTDVDTNMYTTSRFTRVVPDDNSIIIFPSAYWHSVIPVSCPSKQFIDSRFVINGHISDRVPEPSFEEPADGAHRSPASAEATDGAEASVDASSSIALAPGSVPL